MAYTPELSLYHSRILRRIAWALKKPMTHAHAVIVDAAAHCLSESTLICTSCKDKSLCADCPFARGGHPNLEVLTCLT